MDVINRRRSVRSFLAKPLSDHDLEQIIRAAMQAPSARNQQPCHFLIVKEREKLLRIADELSNTQMCREAYCVVVVLLEKAGLTAPLMVGQDGAAATMSMLLEATQLGIGSCWCGIYPRPERMMPVMRILEIPAGYDVFALIPLGYPADSGALYHLDRFRPERIHYEKIS